MEKNFKIRSRPLAALILTLFLVLPLILSSCGLFSKRVNEINLKVDALSLNVGQSITLDSAYYELLPDNAANKKVNLISGDENILSVSESKITGVSAGQTALTLRSVSNSSVEASMVVTVSEVEPSEINITPDGQIFQDAAQTSNVLFSVDFGMVAAQGKQVSWSITKSGQTQTSENLSASEKFSFMPDTHGRFTVNAQTSSRGENISAALDINVYKPYITEPVFNAAGTLVQEEGEYSAVEFSASYVDDPENPERVIEWKVNGEVSGANQTFSYSPQSAGIYLVELFINGIFIGNTTITAKGSIIPKNLQLEFDNCYPNVYLSWDSFVANLGYQVRVYDEGDRLVHSTDISTAHSGTAGYFSGTRVNLTSVIGKDLAKNMFNTSFKIQVKSLGGNGGFKESEYSETLTTPKIPESARKYLDTKYHNSAKNYFLSDNEEFVDILAYFYLWRQTPVLAGSSSDTASHEMYINFPVINAKVLVSDASSALHFTGYSSTQIIWDDDKNILQLIIRFDTDSLPSKATSATMGGYMGGLGSSRPHVDYDKNNRRSSLPVESVNQTVEVESTEQLYYISQLGYRPMPKAGSKAETAYNYAKNVLFQIINDSMTELDKAHAIYDWIMWQVNYDYVVVDPNMTLQESVKYNAYYLEGIFNDTWNYAVCDALAKAYALMCNMENIPCIRVAGIAGEEVPKGADEEAWINSRWGGHAWNKIKLNGSWYIVDLTWGDETLEFNPNTSGASRKYEFAFHRYFLLTDKEVESMRREDQPNNYPRTATIPFNFYAQSFSYGGEEYDMYFNSGESAAREKAERLAGFMTTAIANGRLETSDPLYDPMYSVNNERLQYFPGSPKMQQTNNAFVAFDVKISMTLQSVFSPRVQNSAFRAAFSNLGYKYNTDYQIYETTSFGYYYLFIIIRI